jgi:hypothetical protein
MEFSLLNNKILVAMIIPQPKSHHHQNLMQLSKILARFQAMQWINLILTSNISQCIRTSQSWNIKLTHISLLTLLKSLLVINPNLKSS